MKPPTSLAVAAALIVGLLLPGPVAAGSRTIEPGQVVGMGEDWVLDGDDVLETNRTATLSPGFAEKLTDPADGPGSFIGAIGPGTDAPNDHFGRPAREKR
jgi:hypothetical protein